MKENPLGHELTKYKVRWHSLKMAMIGAGAEKTYTPLDVLDLMLMCEVESLGSTVDNLFNQELADVAVSHKKECEKIMRFARRIKRLRK